MADHDVVLVPSVAEPFGLVAVEAIAAGDGWSPVTSAACATS